MKQKNNIEKSIKSKLFKKTQHYDFTCMVYRNQSYRNAFTKLKKMETNFWFGVMAGTRKRRRKRLLNGREKDLAGHTELLLKGYQPDEKLSSSPVVETQRSPLPHWCQHVSQQGGSHWSLFLRMCKQSAYKRSSRLSQSTCTNNFHDYKISILVYESRMWYWKISKDSTKFKLSCIPFPF